ncbi:phage tail tube protein [Stappia sp. WLB 29]|uniref:phage tail tube protein n=1 Tax=Stappia sp. WLB 29 TaxID=2925220 RepID=UPI0020C11E7D|nr:phage tail tube protein [Stappia sp. WLB 29]
MAAPVFEEFEEMVLEVEFDPDGTPGTYTKICGLLGVQINRSANVDTSETPADCEDESLPLDVTRSVRSIDVTVGGTGFWARGSQGKMKTWFYSGQALNARVTDAAAASGDIATESGPCLLTQLNNAREKGQQVSADIQLTFKSTPTLTAAA